MTELIQWVIANPVEAGAILGGVAYIARQILANAPEPVPGTWWAAVAVVLKVIGAVIPNKPNDPVIKKAAEKAVDAKALNLAAAALPVGVPVAILDQIGGGEGEDRIAARPRFFGPRSTMRRHVRRLARQNGLIDVVGEWDDMQIDEVLDRAELEANDSAAGPIRDLLRWMLDNPQKVLDIIKILMTIFAGDAKVGRARK